MTQIIPRALLAKHFGGDKRMIAAVEQINQSVVDSEGTLASNVEATGAIQDATVLTLSPNEAFTNERVLKLAPGLEAEDDGTYLTIRLKDVARSEGYAVTFLAAGDSEVAVPLVGTLVTLEHLGDSIGNYANDAAAAAGGVPVGGIYHNAGALRVRLT